MRRGSIGVDWAIGIGIFLIFVVFAFAYYINFAPQKAAPIEAVADTIADKLMDYILVDVYGVPVKATYNSSFTGAVMHFSHDWPFGKNSTQVLDSAGNSKQCQISGSTLYWQSDVSSGDNYFTMRYSNQSVSMRCSGTFSVSGSNQTVPWAQEHSRMVSQARVNQMTNTSLGYLKEELDLGRDFRVTFNTSGTLTEYGASPPNATDTLVVRRWGMIEETGGRVEIKVLVW